MRKIKLLSLLPFLLFALMIFFGFVNAQSPTDVSITFDTDRSLYVGVADSEVTELQTYLKNKGYFPTEPTGYFGPITEKAVKEFQSSSNLDPDGIVGPATKEVIERSYSTVQNTSVIIEPTFEVKSNDSTTSEVCRDGHLFNVVTGQRCGQENEVTESDEKLLLGCFDKTQLYSVVNGLSCSDPGDNVNEDKDDETEDVNVIKDEETDEDSTSGPKNCDWRVTLFDTASGEPCFEDRTNDPDINHVQRIMMWHGKVNQHIDEGGDWQTDPDGVSGAGTYAQWGEEGYGDRKLEYCQKWYPEVVSFAPYKFETIHTWKERYNLNNHTSTKMSYICLEESS